MWSQVLRDLLEEFQVIVSHVMDKEPQFAQYLPTFEKFFKTRAAWYIMVSTSIHYQYLLKNKLCFFFYHNHLIV